MPDADMPPSDPQSRWSPPLQCVLAAIANMTSVREALADIAEQARVLAQANSTAIGVLRPGDLLEFVAVAGRSKTDVVGLQIQVHESLAEGALRSGSPQLVEGPGQPLATGELVPTARNAVVVPFRRDGSCAGAIIALDHEGGAPFGASDAASLQVLAECVALALDRDEGLRCRVEQRRELSVLYDASQCIGASLNIQDVLGAALGALCAHLQHQAAAAFLLNDEHTHLFVAANRGLAEEDREVQLSADGKVTSRVLQSRDPVLLMDDVADTDFASLTTGFTPRCAIVAPVPVGADVVGLLVVTSAQPKAYGPEDVRLVATVAAQAGLGVQNAWLYEDAMRRAEEATALYDLSQHVASTLDMDRSLDFVAESTLTLLNADGFALLVYDAEEQCLVPRLCRGGDVAALRRIRPAVGEGIPGWVYEWSTPTAVADVAADARNESARVDTAGVASMLCVPVAMGDEALGVIMALSSKRRLFTVAEMELLYTIANQAAAGLANATMYQAARRQSSDLRRYFNRVAKALGEVLAPGEVPRLTAEMALGVVRGDRCMVYRVDGAELTLVAHSGFRASVPAQTVAVGEGLAGWVARRGKPLVLSNLSEDPRGRVHTWMARDRMASYLGAPLKIGRQTVGVIEVLSQEPRSFTAEGARLLVQFVRRAAVAERLGAPAQ